jgi:Zn-dependent M28 family amino/carboxypeptidase
MKQLLGSFLRIATTVAVALAVVVTVLGLLVRQPSARVIPFQGIERADPARLEAHVRFLSDEVRPRNTRHPEMLDRAARYIADLLAATGGRVELQPYRAGGVACRNVRTRFGPEDGDLLVVGAHYDVCGDLPGADDNASGVAGLLEIARLLSTHAPAVPVELVAFSTEEPPFFGGMDMGSAVHVADLLQRKVPVAGMICLEMIGYFTDDVVPAPWLLALVYPRTGDFVTVVGRWQDRRLVSQIKAGVKGAGGVRVCSFTGPPILGADLSDHRNYWYAGFPAVMVTDTAYLRNPRYHTSLDLPETLDYRRMAAVVDGVFNAIVTMQPSR